MDDNFSYYLIIENNKGRTPTLDNDGEIDPAGVRYLYESVEVPENHVTHLCFDQKIRKPDMNTDCLTCIVYNVFSTKVRDTLTKHMPIKGLQLVPASIENGAYTNFYIVNAYLRITTFDKKLSVYGSVSERYGWRDIKKIVLDKEILSSIPLEERLVYTSKEDCSFILYHQSIIDIIKSVNPVGMMFLPVEEWNPRALFDFTRE